MYAYTCDVLCLRAGHFAVFICIYRFQSYYLG